jgi:RNA polymerase sigma-70 factor (ECF subfamily)
LTSDRFSDADPTVGEVNASVAVAIGQAASAPSSDPTFLLIQAAVRREPAALRAVLEQVSPTLLSAVRRILGAHHPAVEDVLQESLVACVKALAAFRAESSLRTYASRIAVRTALTYSRQARERRAWDAQHELEQGPLSVPSDSPEDAAQAERRRVALRGLLSELPAEQAETFAMRIVLGCSIDEVAAATGVPPNTVRSRMRRAREVLQAKLDANPKLAGLLAEGT